MKLKMKMIYIIIILAIVMLLGAACGDVEKLNPDAAPEGPSHCVLDTASIDHCTL